MRAKLKKSSMGRAAVALVGVLALTGGATLLVGNTASAARSTAGKVAYVKGTAKRSADGKSWKSLNQGTSFYQGDRLKTDSGTRIEAKLNDGSTLRLGANSEVRLDKLSFNKKKKKRKVRAKLFVGRVWAKVSGWFGDDEDNFEVTTANAVAGVRGTAFSTSMDAAGTTQVKVYEGKVLISNKPIYAVMGHTKAKRVEVAGPQEVSLDKREELVAGAMQMVQVASNGEMSQQDFEMASAEDDDWEAWNAERDKMAAK